MITITKEYEFCASHFLPHHLGKCKRLHGHNYTIRVEIAKKGEEFIEAENGMVIDFGRIDSIVTPILNRFDHFHLNEQMQNPTAENFIVIIAELIARTLNGTVHAHENLELISLTLWETKRAFVKWTRD